MGFLQAVLGGLFTILGAASMFFIAYKALTIGNDVAEMKELLRQMQSGGESTGSQPSFPNYPAPLPQDIEDDPSPAMLAHISQAQPEQQQPQREFRLPPPISRRLDAERGIHRGSTSEDDRIRL